MESSVQHVIGFVIYPGMTQLDVTGPHQVFAFMPNAQIHLLWKTKEPVTSAEGLQFLPTTTFNECPPLDVLCVPGGPNQPAMMNDVDLITFLAQQGGKARYVTAVCTGSLILGAAGLLQGYRATSHWAWREQLTALGAEMLTDRVVIDRNRITGGGVTAGIDFGLTVVAQLCGEIVAQVIELCLEYNPQPPFAVGSPEKAGEQLVAQAQLMAHPIIEASWQATQQASERLNLAYQ